MTASNALRGGPRWLLLVYALAALLLAAFVVPQINAGSYRERTRLALEEALGRKVEIGKVQFQLLPQPGLTVENVVIGEDPAVGSEPAAYVTTLRAVPRFTALFGGPFRISSVELEDASLNLTRVDSSRGVRWNFASLMQPGRLAMLPSVHMRGGRVNFKFGDTKSLFYLLDTDVDVWPPASSSDPWTLRVHARPARTDRAARGGSGNFVMRGQWQRRDNSTVLDVRLEQSELGDILTLFNGYESGIQGSISGDAHLAGPLNRIGITGRTTIANLHGWSQTPPGGKEWRFSVGGYIDAAGQVVDLSAATLISGTSSPLNVRYRVADYLQRPRWGVTVNANRFPLAPLPDIARHLGFEIPLDFRFDGVASGAVGYSIPNGSPRMDGSLNFADATLVVANAPPLQIPGAELRFSGSGVSLAPTQIKNDRGEQATIRGDWDTASQKLDLEMASNGMAISSLRRQVSVAGIPLLSSATDGVWRGDLKYSNHLANQEPGWSGDVHLSDALIPFEAFSGPLNIVSADASIDGADISMKHAEVLVGGIRAQGEYRYQTRAARPHKFRIRVATVNGTGLERLLMPTLHRGSFLNYAFNFGRVPEPDWLRNIHAEGTIQAGALDIGGDRFDDLRGRVLWDGNTVQLVGLKTALGDASFAGDATIQLAGRQPAYELEGNISGMSWRGGTIGGSGTVTTSGMGTELLANMKANGTFEARQINLAALDTYEQVTGLFDWAWSARSPQLRLTQLMMKTGADTYQGVAEMGENGQLVIRISDGTRRIQAAGAILRGDALEPVSP